jgi:hypothetical protein
MSNFYLENDPEVKELYMLLKKLFNLPDFVEHLSVTFDAGEPVRVEIVYLPIKSKHVN